VETLLVGLFERALFVFRVRGLRIAGAFIDLDPRVVEHRTRPVDLDLGIGQRAGVRLRVGDGRVRLGHVRLGHRQVRRRVLVRRVALDRRPIRPRVRIARVFDRSGVLVRQAEVHGPRVGLDGRVARVSQPIAVQVLLRRVGRPAAVVVVVPYAVAVEVEVAGIADTVLVRVPQVHVRQERTEVVGVVDAIVVRVAVEHVGHAVQIRVQRRAPQLGLTGLLHV
jgi:hypothetical protein